MSQEFVPDDNLSDGPNDGSTVPEQEVVQITVVGSPAAVSETIHVVSTGICRRWGLESVAARPKAGTSYQCTHQAMVAPSLKIC